MASLIELLSASGRTGILINGDRSSIVAWDNHNTFLKYYRR
ncbi:hypothetical protein T12_13583 [Trichinella patagoniensis]|uniref:Uncharacterized protein n=1 Tax=Trichinella patagoniensis TaxID=990121 RepID=A0A0V1A601_9BILA|nr:hypothetical protein T12_11743 [Trichinella patagoniensis]KRY20225.1 hypothetical protein T12_13583 [Trichinella patagoniensis]